MSLAIQQFLSQSGNHNRVLCIKNGSLTFESKKKVGRWTLFLAKLGFGNASMRKVADFINRNWYNIFNSNPKSITPLNDFIRRYNKQQIICWKKASSILRWPLTLPLSPTPSPPTSPSPVRPLRPSDPSLNKDTNTTFPSQPPKNPPTTLPDLNSEDLKHYNGSDPLTIARQQYEELRILFENVKEFNDDDMILDLTNACALLNASLEDLNPKSKKTNKPVIQNLLILIRKIKIWNKNGPKNPGLSEVLKELRTTALKKHFLKRLDPLATKVSQLKERFEAHKHHLSNPDQFLEKQLEHWDKKLANGKPIAIPKWYHCTKIENVGSILDSSIKYLQQKLYPGAFVSNKPEFGKYGEQGFALSEHIEKTATRDPITRKKHAIFPKYSNQTGTIHYGPVADNLEQMYINKQASTEIWLGFQIDPTGIKMQRPNKSTDPLGYYKDTTIAFLFWHTNVVPSTDIANLKSIASARKLQAISTTELDALRELINCTFPCNLPKEWQGNLYRF